ncbi:Cathepsin_B [Hexamita inflata]|uniref:Cathepsin B n=1 Tax=Hexamita inflata TaxID=28002 RepID=A0AA86UUJ3_9EUKA|nr:Cathepsin B [Hexamita inflata]
MISLLITFCNNIQLTDRLELLKNIPDLTWVPKIPVILQNMSDGQLDEYFRPKPFQKRYIMQTQEQNTSNNSNYPESFDWTVNKPECINFVSQMGVCDASDTFTVFHMLSDQRCIKGLDSERIQYSEQYYMSCNNTEQICDDYEFGHLDDHGTQLSKVLDFLFVHGSVPSQCVQYLSGLSGKSYKCPTQCDDGSELPRLIRIQQSVTVASSSDYWSKYFDDQLKQAITVNGPAEIVFKGYEDLVYYSSGIYTHQFGNYLKQYRGEVVGWGNEDGVLFWKLKMPLGEEWGENGFLRIAQTELDPYASSITV